MALISPGTETPIINESFYIPGNSATVPLLFVATGAEKLQPDGVTAAAGTYESNVVRTVTSIKRSLELYGLPSFLEDSNGNQFHGDCRNEYGLATLNQYLGVGARAFVMRADVNLNDDIAFLRSKWNAALTGKVTLAAAALETAVIAFINAYNVANELVSGDVGFKVTVTGTELKTLARTALESTFNFSSFAPIETEFLTDVTATPLLVFANGYNAVSTGSFIGLDGIINDWVASDLGATLGFEDQFTGAEAESVLLAAADDFKFTREFRDQTSLGANETARRATIVTALQAIVASNQDIRSENYEYNLIVCPGFPELTDDLIALNQDIKEEAFVIGDTPMNLDPEQVVDRAPLSAPNSWQKRNSTTAAYYYPSVKVTNLNGKDVLAPSSTAALRCYAYSDSVSEQWFAPAGTTRGLLASVSDVGYAAGTVGTANTFTQVYLNQGQRDSLYADFTNINPISYFTNRGILVWGQKTAASDASALDRVNVARLLCFIKRQIRKNTMGFTFQPNDAITRDNLKAVVESFLGELVIRRGLEDFAVLCDESNNTAQRRDNNFLYCDIAIKPTKAAEFLVFPIRVVSSGAQI